MAKNNFNKNRINSLIAVLAVVVVVVAFANLYVTFVKVSDFNKKVTGLATGYVNLTVNTQITINVTNGSINFGAGQHDAGQLNATLQTNGIAAATVLRGDWTSVVSGMTIENIGTVNASLKLQTALNAVDFFADVGQQQYKWNISNKESGSCGNWSEETSARNVFGDVNKSAQATICNKFNYAADRNSMYLDVFLTVPYNTTNKSIVLSDTITITGDTAIG